MPKGQRLFAECELPLCRRLFHDTAVEKVDNGADEARMGFCDSDEESRRVPGIVQTRRSPPKLKKPRRSDSLMSGFLDMDEDRNVLTATALDEAVRVFGGKPGTYNAVEACRRYPYGKGCLNVGTVESKIVPRIYFSKPIPKSANDPLPHNHQRRYDYEARFPFGSGPIATDVDNRIIHEWTPGMDAMSNVIHKRMKMHPTWKRLATPSNRFNHAACQLYRDGASVTKHRDQNDTGFNSMKKNSPVAVVTLGGDRALEFFREFGTGKDAFTENHPCYRLLQQHGSVFILDPADEVSTCRRDHSGRRRKNGAFLHGVRCSSGKDYLSIAIIFRCLETTAIVDTATDRVVPEEPKNDAEKETRARRAVIREADMKPGSTFQVQAAKVVDEWIRLMKIRGWINE